MLVDLSTSEKVWAVIRSKPRKEEFVRNYLSAEGREMYLPLVMQRGATGAARPLFPGYLFARISPRFDLAAIKNSPNVLCPLMFSDQLAALEEGTVWRFRASASSGGVIVVEKPERFKRGDIVRINSGSFEGIEAVVIEYIPDKERVRLLLEYFGREVRLEADESLLA